jgi:hypothetical protein
MTSQKENKSELRSPVDCQNVTGLAFIFTFLCLASSLLRRLCYSFSSLCTANLMHTNRVDVHTSRGGGPGTVAATAAITKLVAVDTAGAKDNISIWTLRQFFSLEK